MSDERHKKTEEPPMKAAKETPGRAHRARKKMQDMLARIDAMTQQAHGDRARVRQAAEHRLDVVNAEIEKTANTGVAETEDGDRYRNLVMERGRLQGLLEQDRPPSVPEMRWKKAGFDWG